MNCSQGAGQATGIYCGGETTLEQIDSSGGPWLYFVQANSGCQTYINIEWPVGDDVYYTIETGAQCTVIMFPEAVELNGTEPKLSIIFWYPPLALKTIGCSLTNGDTFLRSSIRPSFNWHRL